MAQTRVIRCFTRALFDLAVQKGRLDAVHRDLSEIRDVLRKCPDLQRFLGNYMIPAERRGSVLKELFEGRLDPLMYRFLLQLEQANRLHLIEPIGVLLDTLVNQHRGLQEVRVTSTLPLTEDQTSWLKEKLESQFRLQVLIKTKIDPSLLGGFTAQAGDLVYDASLVHQLKLFKEKILFT